MLLTAALDDCIAFNTLPAAYRFGGTEARGLYAYDYNTAYVSITDILGLTGAEWTFDGNALYITVKGGAGLPEQTDVSYGEPGGKEIDKINFDIYANGEKTDITYMGGGPLLTGGRVYENGAEAYLYDSAVHIDHNTKNMCLRLKPISMIRLCIYRCIRPKR